MVGDGRLIAHLTRGGRTVLMFSRPTLADDGASGSSGAAGADPGDVQAVVGALSDLVREGRLSPVTVERINGVDVLSLGREATGVWTGAGARFTPKGLVVR